MAACGDGAACTPQGPFVSWETSLLLPRLDIVLGWFPHGRFCPLLDTIMGQFPRSCFFPLLDTIMGQFPL